MTRNGKIARLPREIREELNRSLERNIPGITLVEWLNSLPEVQEILASLFDSKPISPQNLSEWRLGGFVEWQTRRDLIEDMRETMPTAAEVEAIAPLMADHAARVLTARIAVMLSNWNGDPDDPVFARIKQLSALVRIVVALRRSEHNSARLQMDQYRFYKFHRLPVPIPQPPAPAAPFPPPPVHPIDTLIPEAAKTQSNQIKPLSSVTAHPSPRRRSTPPPTPSRIARRPPAPIEA